MDLTLKHYAITDDITVIEADGEVDVYTAPRLRELAISLINNGKLRLIFDLKIEGIDSTGIGVLVGVLKRIYGKRTSDTEKMVLAIRSERVERIFRITGLNRVFPICQDVHTAVAQMYEQPSKDHGWGWITSRAYASNASARLAIGEGLSILGPAFKMSIAYKFPANKDSQFLTFVLRIEKQVPPLSSDELLVALHHAIYQHISGHPASRSEAESQAVSQFMEMLSLTTEGIIQIGPLLLIRTGGVNSVRLLSPTDLARYESNPSLFTDAGAAKRELDQMSRDTDQVSDRFFAFIGPSWPAESAIERAESSGILVRRRSLHSRAASWEAVSPILNDRMLMGALVRFSPANCRFISLPDQADVAESFFRAMRTVPHAVFLHESIFAKGYPLATTIEGRINETKDDALFASGMKEDEVRASLVTLLREHEINVIPYKTESQLSALSSAFIDDNEKNLLFRIYVPSDRLYANEADRILSIFRDWLRVVGKYGIRQEGYVTDAGRIYEFFGKDTLNPANIGSKFQTFSTFLNSCTENPESAVALLARAGLERRKSEKLVGRYGKEVRRLQLDIRQERETRILTIRHSLEAELLDAGIEDPAFWAEINEMIDHFVPQPQDLAPMSLLAIPGAPQASPVTLNINQQVINAVESTVIQNVQGTLNFGASAKEIMGLIQRFGAPNQVSLQTALQEFEDPDVSSSDHLNAKQKLKGFLLQLGGKIEDAALTVLEKYLESKL